MSTVTRCIRYLTANGKRTVHRVRYGRADYRTQHNLREIQRIVKLTALGKVVHEVHMDQVRYQPYLDNFAAKFNARENGPRAIFLFNTVNTYLYDTDDHPTPGHYEPGVILVVRQSDQLVQTALRTDMLDELYRLRSSRAQLGVAIKNVNDWIEATGGDDAPLAPMTGVRPKISLR